MQLKSAPGIRRLTPIIAILLFASNSLADVIAAPDCPSEVKLIDGKVELSNGWSYSIPKRFLDAKGKTTLKSGLYKIGGKAPVISEINSFTGTVSSHIGADEDEITDKTETYIWKKPYNFVKNKAVFMCWALGNETEVPRGNIYLYREITEDFSECKLTYYLHDGKRDWNKQKMECQ